MNETLRVRPSTSADRPAILDVVGRAFTTAGRDGQHGRDGREELEIVRSIWDLDAAAEGLDLVATVDGLVVGHVLFEPSWPFGIFYRPVGAGSPHFQVRRLDAYTPELRGEYVYAWERPSHGSPEDSSA